MKNVKDEVYAALDSVFDNVSDLYPADWATLPAIQYAEENNRVQERTEEGEQKSYVRYRIDIWNGGSTSEASLKVDQAISALGLERIECADVPDPSGLRHKQMRYEGVIDMDTDLVYGA